MRTRLILALLLLSTSVALAAPFTTGRIPKAINGSYLTDSSIYEPVAGQVHIDGAIYPTAVYGDGSHLTGISTQSIDLSLYAPKASPTFTGTVSGISAAMVGLGNVSNVAQVTSVTGTSPIVSSGGTTPAISISATPTFTSVTAETATLTGAGDSIFASDVEFQGAVTIAGIGDTTFTTDVQVDGTITNPGIAVTSGNYVCFNTTTKAFYVKSSCP